MILMIDYKLKYKLSKTKPYVKLLKYTISLSRDYVCLKSRICKHLHMLMFLKKYIQEIHKAKYRLHKQHLVLLKTALDTTTCLNQCKLLLIVCSPPEHFAFTSFPSFSCYQVAVVRMAHKGVLIRPIMPPLNKGKYQSTFLKY